MSHIKQLLQGTRVDSLLPSGPRPSVVEILSTELPAAAFQVCSFSTTIIYCCLLLEQHINIALPTEIVGQRHTFCPCL